MQVIDFDAAFGRLVAAASTDRDRLLLSAMYDLGLRIGPKPWDCRHSDLDPMRRRVRIVRRDDNINGALSKQRAQFTVDAPAASSTCTPATFSARSPTSTAITCSSISHATPSVRR